MTMNSSHAQFDPTPPAPARALIVRKRIGKRIGKILEMPELGKPLHAPLNNYKSERMEKHRIVYKVVGSTVVFAWLEHRKHVYE